MVAHQLCLATQSFLETVLGFGNEGVINVIAYLFASYMTLLHTPLVREMSL